MIKHYLFLSMLFPSVLVAQQVTTLVNNPATQFRDDLIFDAAGNLYCADYSGNSVFKRSPDGTVTVFASGFDTPNGLAFDSQNNLFVADNIGNRIYKLDYSGQFLDTLLITGPSGLLKMQDSDTLLFTQYPGNSLSKLAPDGTIVPVYSGAPLNGAVGLAWSPDGHLYVANFNDSKVFEVVFGANVTLDSLATVPEPSSGAALLGFIEYAKGFIWATSFNANKIYKINPANGQVTHVAGNLSGSTDGDVTTARFSKPNGIVASTTGDTLYISDYGTGRLRMMTDIPLGIIDLEQIPVALYPNPSGDYFYLDFPQEVVLEKVILLDLTGKQLRHWDNPEQGTTFSLSGLSEGNYVLRIESAQQAVNKHLIER